jgi:hypothetical protein
MARPGWTQTTLIRNDGAIRDLISNQVLSCGHGRERYALIWRIYAAPVSLADGEDL